MRAKLEWLVSGKKHKNPTKKQSLFGPHDTFATMWFSLKIVDIFKINVCTAHLQNNFNKQMHTSKGLCGCYCMLRMTDAHLVCSVYKLTFFIRVVFLRLEMSPSTWLYVGISINANLYNLYNYWINISELCIVH